MHCIFLIGLVGSEGEYWYCNYVLRNNNTSFVASLFSKTSTMAVRILAEAPRSFGSRGLLFCGSVNCMSCSVTLEAALICSSGSRLLNIFISFKITLLFVCSTHSSTELTKRSSSSTNSREVQFKTFT